MDAGRLNQRVILQERILNQDDMGGSTEAFIDNATVWAQVSPLKGNQLLYAQQRDAKTDTRIVLRYRDNIKPDWKIKFGKTVYRITAIINPDSDKTLLEVYCEALRHENAIGSVDTPEITNAANIGKASQITSSPFTTTDGDDEHRSTQWQVAIADQTNWQVLSIDTTTSTEKETYNIAAGILEPDTDYIARVRYVGVVFGCSGWSDTVEFTTEP